MALTHDELAADLAGHLWGAAGVMVWTDIQLGPAGSPRPDVYTLRKSFADPRPLAYEVKISRADFHNDTTRGKWQSYLAYAQGVYFAAPVDMLQRSEIPPHCGLIVRGETGWHSLKRPTLQPLDQIPTEALLKLIIDGVEREGPRQRLKNFCAWVANKKISKRWGEEAALALTNLGDVKYQIEAAEQESEKIRTRARQEAELITMKVLPELSALREALHLHPDTCASGVVAALRRERNIPNGTEAALKRIHQIAGEVLGQ